MTTKRDMSANSITDVQLDNEAKSMHQILSEQPKRKVRLFLGQEERMRCEANIAAGRPAGFPQEVVIFNGVRYDIPRGVEVEVPECVYETMVNAHLV